VIQGHHYGDRFRALWPTCMKVVCVVQVVYFLAGLTCDDENFINKAGAQVCCTVPHVSEHRHLTRRPSRPLWLLLPALPQSGPLLLV